VKIYKLTVSVSFGQNKRKKRREAEKSQTKRKVGREQNRNKSLF
jgi:hypothetical protein